MCLGSLFMILLFFFLPAIFLLLQAVNQRCGNLQERKASGMIAFVYLLLTCFFFCL